MSWKSMRRGRPGKRTPVGNAPGSAPTCLVCGGTADHPLGENEAGCRDREKQDKRDEGLGKCDGGCLLVEGTLQDRERRLRSDGGVHAIRSEKIGGGPQALIQCRIAA